MNEPMRVERRQVRPEVAETFRQAIVRAARAQHELFMADEARQEANAAFVAEVDGVASGQVRRAHPDWFHANGNRRGAFRAQIEREIAAGRLDLWVRHVPDAYDVERFSLWRHIDGVPDRGSGMARRHPDEVPPPPPTPQDYRGIRKAELERMLEPEDDPARRDCAIAALDALEAVLADEGAPPDAVGQ